MEIIKKYWKLILLIISLILNTVFLFYIINLSFLKNNRDSEKVTANNDQAVKINYELENKMFILDNKYKELNNKYNQLEKSEKELQLKNDNLIKAISSKKNEFINSLVNEKNELLINNNSLKEELDQNKNDVKNIAVFLNSIEFKKEYNETDINYISRSINTIYNDLNNLKNNQSGTKIDQQKLNKIIDTMFSLSNINGIIIGKNREDIIINSSKIDYILKNATFITYDKDRDHANGIIEIIKINNQITYKIIKGNVNEKSFF